MRSLDDQLQDDWGQTAKPQGAETHMARILMDVYAKRCGSRRREDLRIAHGGQTSRLGIVDRCKTNRRRNKDSIRITLSLSPSGRSRSVHQETWRL